MMVFIGLLFAACNESYTPKPRGFFGIDLPEKKYRTSELNCPFNFEYGSYAELDMREEYCWFNITYPKLNGIIHMSYKSAGSNLRQHINNSHDLAYKHSRVAEGINEQEYRNPEKNVFGIVYDFEGHTATAMQFYLTDSSQHFIRGALYFKNEMNDSILPVSNFIKEDIYHLIESWQWEQKKPSSFQKRASSIF